MTISSETSRITYTGNGATSVYAYPFRVDDDDDFVITKKGTGTAPPYTTLVKTTDYTVDLVSKTITLVAGNLPSGYLLTIRRKLQIIQPSDLTNQGSFFASTHEMQFDKLVMILQQLQDMAARSIKLKETEAGTAVATEIDDPTTRANNYLGFDGSGNLRLSTLQIAGALTVSAFIQTLLDDADAPTSRTTLGATGASGTWATAQIADDAITPAKVADSAQAHVFEARLTWQTGVPVPQGAGTSLTTMYVTPYKGDKIALYTGSKWQLFTLTEKSIAVPSTTNTNYDLFIYDNAGTLTLDAVAWTNDTTRATALAVQNGVYVKTGALGRRYVGSFRTGAVSGNCTDNVVLRHVWNYYHRVNKEMVRSDTTNTWNYTTATMRQANAAAANQLDFLIGVAEVSMRAEVFATARNTNAGVDIAVGVGLNSTSSDSSSIQAPAESQVANQFVTASAQWFGVPGAGSLVAGRHTLVWLEFSEAVGTTTWTGDNGDGIHKSGIYAEFMG